MSNVGKVIDAIEDIVDKKPQQKTELEKLAERIAFEIVKNEDNWEGPSAKEKPPEPQRKDTSNQSE